MNAINTVLDATIIDWGRLPYRDAHNRQLAALADRIAGRIGMSCSVSVILEKEEGRAALLPAR